MSKNVPTPNSNDAASANQPIDPSAPAKSKLKMAISVVVLLLLPFAALALVWKDRCKRTELQSVASPSGEYTAQHFRVDCGPSMAVATEIRLFKVVGGKLGDNSTVLVLPSDELLEIIWADAQTITIQLPGRQAQVVKYRREWAGVHVGLIGDVVSSVPKDLENMFD